MNTATELCIATLIGRAPILNLFEATRAHARDLKHAPAIPPSLPA